MNPTLTRIKMIWDFDEPVKLTGPRPPYSHRLDLLKWIAIFTMFIDHIGYFFFPNIEEFRMIGRLAFPIFAYLIAEGALRTTNRRKYLTRLWLFALLSQIPFMLAFDNGVLNVLFTLFGGLLLIHVGWQYIGLIGMVSLVLPLDYGWFGIFLVYGFYLFLKSRVSWQKALVLLAIVGLHFLHIHFQGWTIQYYGFAGMLLALLLPEMKWCQRLWKDKWFFYIFYPAHILVIAIIHITFFR